MTQAEEYFGTPSQQALQRRAALLWSLVREDSVYSCHGRAVGLAEARDDNISQQIALAQLLGAGAVEGVPGAKAQARREQLEANGLVVDQYVDWEGGTGAIDAARRVLATRPLADDLQLVAVDATTPTEDMVKLDALTQSCEVLLPMGRFMRGLERPSVCLFAQDRAGNIVGATSSVCMFHPDHPKSGTAWWGMLATSPARRGEGIALTLGAHSLLAMHEKYGIEHFFTGIREGNTPSEALCSKLGLAPTDNVVQVAIDSETLGGGRVTK